MVSAPPDEGIKVIVEKKNLTHYFLEVHGSPKKKQELVPDIAARHACRLEDCLFIGDAATDYEAAKSCGTVFWGIVKDGERSPFSDGTRILARVMGNWYDA